MSPPSERLSRNPFYVLELPTTATRAEVERQGQKLLAMLGVGLGQVQRYPTPLGERVRTETLVRVSVDALRDPEARRLHELWAQGTPHTAPPEEPAAAPSPSWPNALEALGWRSS